MPRRRLSFFLTSRWVSPLLLSVVFLTALAIFVFWEAAREATLSRMGVGLVPALLWFVALALVVCYRPRWALKRWRGWLGGAFLVAAILGMLSFFQVQLDLPLAVAGGWSNILEVNSPGGRYGQLLGGYPLLLGALKVFGLLSLACLALAPGLTIKAYRRGSTELLLFTWLMVFALLRFIVLLTRYIRARMFRVEEAASAPFKPLVQRMTSLGAGLSFRKKVPTWRDLAAPGEWMPSEAGKEVEARGGLPTSKAEPREAKQAPGKKGGQLRAEVPSQPHQEEATWVLPPLGLLDKSSTQPVPPEKLREMAQRIERTLGEHGLEVRVETVRPGPRVILFGLVPGWVRRHTDGGAQAGAKDLWRVKVDSIMAREKDLALALKTPSIRLLTPVPGEQRVGLEVPNPDPDFVPLRTVVESSAFQRITKAGGLPIALGAGPGGEPVAIDLREMPHLLLAGATGSGKSVCINAVVCSLILTRTPQELRLLMVDPKRVELTPFNGIPHLLIPAIVDTDQVVPAFQRVLTEMFRRYRLMEEVGSRAIDTYNKRVSEPLPHVVIVVDELADLMMAEAYQVEQSLVRLAQLGRATGIHLVLATQRPSVNVVTGLMKANISARIAFAVASQVDSRVILDTGGAEKLLGKGDMLFLSPSEPKPQRIQGSYVSDKENERLVLYWKSQRGPVSSFSLAPAAPASADGGDGEEPMDDGAPEEERLLHKAREVAAGYKRLSPSVLQRRLRIGYAKALRLIELLEEEGTVAPGDPGTSRPVLLHSKGEGEPS